MKKTNDDKPHFVEVLVLIILICLCSMFFFNSKEKRIDATEKSIIKSQTAKNDPKHVPIDSVQKKPQKKKSQPVIKPNNKTPLSKDFGVYNTEDLEYTEPMKTDAKGAKDETEYQELVSAIKDDQTFENALVQKPEIKFDEHNSQNKIVVIKSLFEMQLYDSDKLIASYPVKVGKPEYETPSGIYSIGEIYLDSEWSPSTKARDDYKKENILWASLPFTGSIPGYSYYSTQGKNTLTEGNLNALGVMFMEIHWQANYSDKDQGHYEESLGIHGTNEPDKIPGPNSRGCIGMHNKDVTELYNWLMNKIGVQVIVKKDETI